MQRLQPHVAGVRQTSMRIIVLFAVLALGGCIAPAGENPTAGLAPAPADPGAAGVSAEAGSGRQGFWADPNLPDGPIGPGGFTQTDPLLPPGGLNPY